MNFGAPSLQADRDVTPLHVAVANQNLELAKFLLDHGADVNARDAEARTPLHFAVDRRDFDLMRLLLDAKADPDARSAAGESPLAIANRASGMRAAPNLPGRGTVWQSESKPMVALLRERGARTIVSDPNAITVSRSSSGYSAKVLTRGTNDWNHFTLLELLAVQYGLLAQSGTQEIRPQPPTSPRGSSDPLAFPDFARIRITRPLAEGGEKVIPVDLSAAVKTADCSADVALEWGDVVEIPEEDPPLDARWGLTDDLRAALKRCLERKVEITVKGERNTYEIQLPYYRSSNGVSWVLAETKQRYGWDVRTTLDRSGFLRTSSDRTAVMVRRMDPTTGTLQEWRVDCTAAGDEPGLWLRDGDVIEVPDKAEASPAAVSTGTARVLGEVKRPGVIALEPGKPKDIIDAIAECGGLTDQARPQIEFTRAGETRRFTLDRLKAEADPAKKLWLQPGDTIEAKRTVF